MIDKKMKIIQSAIQLFGERDYHTTSVQDIASLAGVSKGAFYMHFHSKEELLISIHSYFFDVIRAGLDKVLLDSTIQPKQRLVHAIRIQCELIIGNKEYLTMMQINGATFMQNDTIKELIIKMSFESLHWFQQRIVEVYGPDIEDRSLDCSIIMNSMAKEYLFLKLVFHVPIDIEELATFLYERLDDIVEGIIRKNTAPILPSLEQLRSFLSCKSDNMWLLQINTIKQWIEGHINDTRVAEKMLQSLEAIVTEHNKEIPNEVILHGMHNYILTLGKDHTQLKQLLDPLFITNTAD